MNRCSSGSSCCCCTVCLSCSCVMLMSCCLVSCCLRQRQQQRSGRESRHRSSRSGGGSCYCSSRTFINISVTLHIPPLCYTYKRTTNNTRSIPDGDINVISDVNVIHSCNVTNDLRLTMMIKSTFFLFFCVFFLVLFFTTYSKRNETKITARSVGRFLHSLLPYTTESIQPSASIPPSPAAAQPACL